MTGRGWAYSSLGLGGIGSIAANVAHSYVPPADAPTGWQPHAGAVVSAIVWPVFLFFAIEMLARVAWPRGAWWALLRFGGLVPVALVAAFVSYQHLSGLLAFYGEDALTVRIGPLAVDGLMVMATGALIATGARRAAMTVPSGHVPVAPVHVPDGDATIAPRTRRHTPTKRADVAAAAARMPGATPAAIAAKAGVSESTARRHLNGAAVLQEVSR
jgi:hypothetical protein